MSEPTDDFEYERRFFCRELPAEYDDGDAPTLIIQSYYVHADNYALRVRLVSRKVHVDMTPDVNPVAVLDEYRDRFSEAYVTVKGPSVGGTRYEVEREIDTRIAAELIKRGGSVIIKNRYSVWIEEDGWSVDVFGGPNAPLIVAEAERSGPVTNLTIPIRCSNCSIDIRKPFFRMKLRCSCLERGRAPPDTDDYLADSSGGCNT